MANAERVPFGALLLRLRTAAGLTQQQLAARAGLSPQAVAALERGRRRAPRASTVDLLAAALGLDADARAQLLMVARGADGTAGTEGSAAPERAATAAVSGAALSPMADAVPGLRRRTWWLARAPTPLVDRVHELDTMLRLLTGEGGRLMTLTGPAGVGKTRLALEAAARLASYTGCFPDGVALVDLTPIRDPLQVLGTIARALGLLDIGNRPLLEHLVEVLEARHQLLVLDNLEQVLPAAATQLTDLLALCPGLTLLVTSRAPLQLRWEQELRVPPLPVPDLALPLPPLEELTAIPAVALFVQRAQARQPDFRLTEEQASVAARLVVQLDGLPLALELAAARTATLPLPVIATRLEDRLRLLRWEASDLPERQRSLEAAVGWSYDLLSDEERRLFRCLGVFAGRVTLDAITAVARAVDDRVDGGDLDGGRTLEGLLSLAEHSLLLPIQLADRGWQYGGFEDGVDNGEEAAPAFGMLETVREYAQERLTAAGELTVARRAHAHSFLALAEHAEPELRRHNQITWLFRLEQEQDNLRAALRWLLGQDDLVEREGALRLASALGWFWWQRGYHAEGVRWLEEALARATQGAQVEGARQDDAIVRSRTLLYAGAMYTLQGVVGRARDLLKEALALSQRQQDPAGIVQALTFLGVPSLNAEQVERGRALREEALQRARGFGEPYYVGMALLCLATAAKMQGNAAEATARYTEALNCLQTAGDRRIAGSIYFDLSEHIAEQGDLASAVRYNRVGLEASVRLRDRWLLGYGVAALLTVVGDLAEPMGRARLLGAADTLYQMTGAGRTRWGAVPPNPGQLEVHTEFTRDEMETAYQSGRSLPFGEVATLALHLLDEVAQALSRHEAKPAGAMRPEPRPRRGDRSPLRARG